MSFLFPTFVLLVIAMVETGSRLKVSQRVDPNLPLFFLYVKIVKKFAYVKTISYIHAHMRFIYINHPLFRMNTNNKKNEKYYIKYLQLSFLFPTFVQVNQLNI